MSEDLSEDLRATDELDPLAGLDELLLGGPRIYTRAEVAERSGISLEHARRLWRALGFSAVPDHVVAFTEGDVEALRCVGALTEQGILDDESGASIARVLGRSMSRIAQLDGALVGTWLTRQVAAGALPDPVADGARIAAQVLPQTELLMRHVWRRHIAAVAGGFLTEAVAPPHDEVAVTVGFVDLSGFTALSRRLDDEALLRLLDTFEAEASDTVSAYGGRVVKTAGDGLLFVVADPVAAARASLDLVERGARGGRVAVRVGLAFGPVLRFAGDVYGETVNVAARLTGIAKPRTVLADRGAADVLSQTGEFSVGARRLRRVRGYRRLATAEVRRAGVTR